MSFKIQRAHQTQMSSSRKQGATASKGVSYCNKCERRKLRKLRLKELTRERNPVFDTPPLCLFQLWMMVCIAFYVPDQSHRVLIWTKNTSMFMFLLITLIDCLRLFVLWYRRFRTPVLDPQSGICDWSGYTLVNNHLSVDPYLKEAVQVWCLFESLRDSRTKRGMIAAITQYLQAHVKDSLPLYVYRQVMRIDYISDWTSDDGHAQIEEMLEEAFGRDAMRETAEELLILDTQDGELHQMPWHVAMDSAFQNWKEFRHSSISKKVTHLINVIVSSGMCATADLTFKLGNVHLFSPMVIKRQLAAADIFEAFYEAVSGFMKGGWRVFQTGEVSAFFMEEDKIAEFDKMYNELRSLYGYAIAGNLREYTSTDDNEYDKKLKTAIEYGANLLHYIKKDQTFERKYVSDRLERLRDNESEFTQLRTRGGLRVTPFAVCLFGQSGCGKSCLTNLTVNAGLVYNKLSAEKDRIATWADNDKYASSIRSHINAIIFDDFANTKEVFMESSPAYRLIQVINNIKYLAPMADVFLKGKVSLNPYFCVVSSNVEHLNAAKYSNEPESVLRRMYHVKVEPKEECCEKGMLCRRKVEALYGRTPCPDAWKLSVRYYAVQNKRYVDLEAMTPVVFEGKELTNIGIHDYLRWVQIASKEHFTEEGQYIANQESIPKACETCSMVYCKCIPKEESKIVEKIEAEVPEESVKTKVTRIINEGIAEITWKNRGKTNLSQGLYGTPCRDRIAEVEITKNPTELSRVILEPHAGNNRIAEIKLTHGSTSLSQNLSGEPGIVREAEVELSHGTTRLSHLPETQPESSCLRDYFSKRAFELKACYANGVAATMIATARICEYWERIDFLPEKYICHPRVLKFGLFFWREDIKRSLAAGNSFIMLLMVTLMWVMPCLSVFWLFSTLLAMYWYTSATIQTYRRLVRNRIMELRDVVQTYTQQWQSKYAIIGLGAIGIILATMRARNSQEERVHVVSEGLNSEWKPDVLDAHTGLNPESQNEIDERNDAVNPWLAAKTVPLPMSIPSKTTTSDDLAAAMRTNLIGVVSDIDKTSLGFYLVSNFVLLPTHFLDYHGDRDIGIRCYKAIDSQVGRSFRDKISKSFRVSIPGTDFTLCFITGGGSMKDFRKFLPLDKDLRRCSARLVSREIQGTELKSFPMLFQGTGLVAHTQKVFWGSYYKLPFITQPGMCMSPVISDMKGCTILGFHLGGKEETGGCGTLTLDQANFAINELASVDGVVLSASSGTLKPEMGDFTKQIFGKDIFQGAEIHPKSAVNFLPEGACIDVYGKTLGKATPKSSVVPTLISEAVAEVFGVPQQWGPPKMKGKGRYPFQATLKYAAIPSLPIGSVLERAVIDIKKVSKEVKAILPELFSVKPLSRVETVSGIDGVKFVDPMNMNTSPGIPLSGNKHPYIIELNPEDYPGISKPRTFTPEIWEEFDRMVSILESGVRSYVPWKACLKDEATKLTKDDVRVFQCAPVMLQLLVRMYFLPIVRIIQMNPIRYECAVGVNAEGLEWEELWEAAMSKGRERVLAGDYSKYDARMPAQVTIAAFDILIDIASMCEGYTEKDLHIMRMVVHEIVYPVIAYNGDLIQLFGTNPSGQNLTVIINSLANSILLRSCFFTIYPDKDFKENCAFMTYGDDVIGTVSASCDGFTHITYAKWLAEHDMKFTMPDKESTPVHYMTEKDVDFLKRKSEFNEDLGCKVGLLSEKSIFKRLHAHILSKELTMEMHSAQNIESSLHDWFYYGREIFEDRREKLRAVARKCEIEHLCPALDVSYDKRVAYWRHKYLGEDLIDEEVVSLE